MRATLLERRVHAIVALFMMLPCGLYCLRLKLHEKRVEVVNLRLVGPNARGLSG